MVNKTGIMLQGTSSHVGKSLLATALCRIFYQEGYSTAPFKAQNMALNSMVTPWGEEMGRAQGVQAEAAGTVPDSCMNPILIKPKGDMEAQIIIQGKPRQDMSARDYRENFLPQGKRIIKEAIASLKERYQVLVLEGAGSPAEINLKDGDLVNMATARWSQVPVLLVADIDRGGVFASLVGTLQLLEPWERKLVKGFIINKFRGDVELLKPGLKMLEERTGKPVLGVVPYLHAHGIEEEDSVSLQESDCWGPIDASLKIAVIQLPRLSNFTDLDPLIKLPDTRVFLVKPGKRIGEADAVIIPGSKNTFQDLKYLKEQGYPEEIADLVKRGSYLIGICGGYQMLGEELKDPQGSENGDTGEEDFLVGLGYLPLRTTFSHGKSTHQVEAELEAAEGWLAPLQAAMVEGYEIHAGKVEFTREHPPLLTIIRRSEDRVRIPDGASTAWGKVWGTHLHGIFHNRQLLLAFANALRQSKGKNPLAERDLKDSSRGASYDSLAHQVRSSLDMERLYKIMGLAET